MIAEHGIVVIEVRRRHLGVGADGLLGFGRGERGGRRRCGFHDGASIVVMSVVLELLEVLGVWVAVVGGTEPECGLELR